MGKTPDPVIYINGELDDAVTSFSASPEFSKEPVDTMTPSGEAAHVDYGNKRYPFTLGYKPVSGRDNNKWLRMQEDTTEPSPYTILEDYRDGNRYLYSQVHVTKVDKPTGKGGEWTITGFAIRHTPMQSSSA